MNMTINTMVLETIVISEDGKWHTRRYFGKFEDTKCYSYWLRCTHFSFVDRY